MSGARSSSSRSSGARRRKSRPGSQRRRDDGAPVHTWRGRCSARCRDGSLCRRPPLRGRERCRQHGGASTGPRTERGKLAAAIAPIVHGAYATSDKFEAILASQHQEIYAAADAATNVTRELRFARARLALAVQNGAPVAATADLLTEIRLLATAEKELNPGGGFAGKTFELTIRRVGGTCPHCGEPVDDAVAAPARQRDGADRLARPGSPQHQPLTDSEDRT